MNIKFFFALTFALSALLSLPATAQENDNTKQSRKGWKLVWKDDFKGKEIDPTSWRRCVAGTSDWDRNMSPLDSLCRVRNGVLELWGIPTPEGLDESRPYITGGVYSEGLRSVQNGRFDVRAKFGFATGFWPAIWLMPDAKIGWPHGGEIDIMEHLNADDIAYQTVHSAHTYYFREPKSKNGNTMAINKEDFNVYSVEISDYEITFYINGEKNFSYSKMEPTPEDQYPFSNHPFYIILSAQLGGTWVGKVNIEDLPVKMEVDYVKFYERR